MGITGEPNSIRFALHVKKNNTPPANARNVV